MSSDNALDTLLASVAAALTRPVRAGGSAELITRSAVDLLPGVDFASIVVSRPSKPLETLAPTDPRALEADRLQEQLAEGPALEVLDTSLAVTSPDLGSDRRWPLYGAKAVASGLLAQAVRPLQLDGRDRAVLNLYSATRGSLDQLGTVGTVFTSHAAVAWSCAEQMQHLSVALESRKSIGQAVGMLMERYTISEDAAFAFLTRASQTANIKLRDIAVQIVTSPDDRQH